MGPRKPGHREAIRSRLPRGGNDDRHDPHPGPNCPRGAHIRRDGLRNGPAQAPAAPNSARRSWCCSAREATSASRAFASAPPLLASSPASTSSRIYVDTLTKLKLLTDLENVSLADLLDKIVLAEFTRRRKELHQTIDRLAGEE